MVVEFRPWHLRKSARWATIGGVTLLTGMAGGAIGGAPGAGLGLGGGYQLGKKIAKDLTSKKKNILFSDY